MDSKSGTSNSNKKQAVDGNKIMDYGNTNQMVLSKDDDGGIKIDQKEVTLEDLHTQYEAAMREVKRLKKAFEKKRDSMKYWKTPVLSEDER